MSGSVLPVRSERGCRVASALSNGKRGTEVERDSRDDCVLPAATGLAVEDERVRRSCFGVKPALAPGEPTLPCLLEDAREVLLVGASDCAAWTQLL